MGNSSWKPHVEFADPMVERYEEQLDEHGKTVYGEISCGPVLPIAGPPCVRCRYWKPQKNYLANELFEGEAYDNGVTLCHAPGYEMWDDFSCFRDRGQEEIAKVMSKKTISVEDINEIAGRLTGGRTQERVEALANALVATGWEIGLWETGGERGCDKEFMWLRYPLDGALTSSAGPVYVQVDVQIVEDYEVTERHCTGIGWYDNENKKWWVDMVIDAGQGVPDINFGGAGLVVGWRRLAELPATIAIESNQEGEG